MLARITAGVLGATLVFGSMGYGQQQPQGGPPDFAQMRQQMMDRLKDAMGASDDEWKVMQPKIDNVQQLQRQTGGRGPGMFGPSARRTRWTGKWRARWAAPRRTRQRGRRTRGRGT